jgi:diaminohydroxyphosphoribosylaminopyrimidine deaminase/5-amino-6-(5-phosphoribosylamino)uracil reductase
MQDKQDEKYMNRCLELAKKGLGTTYPNPLVGSVIVYKDKIIGEGFHKKAGEAHAEVLAVKSVKDKSLLKKSTLYVNLEPCAHHGRTPACSDMIIREAIPRVVIGCKDSYEEVDGKGIKMLKKAGVNVITGVLEKESREINNRFFTFHEKRRPYIILKWAQTVDGFIDFERKASTPVKPNWITDEFARVLVHKWRAEEQSIMAATNTVEKDNPKLNLRDWSGIQPVRVILDRNLRLSKELHVFDGTQRTIVFTEKSEKNRQNLEYIQIDFSNNFYKSFFDILYTFEIQSIFVEGGAQLLQNLIDRNHWDEARVFIGKGKFFNGVKAPAIKKQAMQKEQITDSLLYTYKNTKSI